MAQPSTHLDRVALQELARIRRAVDSEGQGLLLSQFLREYFRPAVQHLSSLLFEDRRLTRPYAIRSRADFVILRSEVKSMSAFVVRRSRSARCSRLSYLVRPTPARCA